MLLDGYLSLKDQTFKNFDFVYLQILAEIKDKRAVVINISVRIAYLLLRTDGSHPIISLDLFLKPIYLLNLISVMGKPKCFLV